MQIALMQSHICARNIASMVGRIISMGLVLGPVTRFMTKGYYAMLESHVAGVICLQRLQRVQLNTTFLVTVHPWVQWATNSV